MSHEIQSCPYCNHPCEADWVDVGVGFVQCGPYHCDACGSSEIGGFDEERVLTDKEKKYHWYEPGSNPGSSVNVIGGKIVSCNAMRQVYREEFINNPLHSFPGYVDEWREHIRKNGLNHG